MTRRRSRGPRRVPVGLVLAVVLLSVSFGAGHMATSSFTAGDTPRGASIDATGDGDGAHSLAVASAVHTNSTDVLVNVTNHLGRDVTATVALQPESTDIGDLVVDGSTVGDSATFSLTAGERETVRISIPDDSSLTDRTVYFDVNASDNGFAVSAVNRSSPVDP